MAKKIFTDESLATLVDETKSYVENTISTNEFITVEDIDAICGNTIIIADSNDVVF